MLKFDYVLKVSQDITDKAVKAALKAISDELPAEACRYDVIQAVLHLCEQQFRQQIIALDIDGENKQKLRPQPKLRISWNQYCATKFSPLFSSI